VVIPLTHHKNSGYTELKVFGIYLSVGQRVQSGHHQRSAAVINHSFYRLLCKNG